MKRMSFSAEQWMSIHGIEKAIKRLKVSPQGKSHLQAMGETGAW